MARPSRRVDKAAGADYRADGEDRPQTGTRRGFVPSVSLLTVVAIASSVLGSIYRSRRIAAFSARRSSTKGRTIMRYRSSIAAVVLMMALCMTIGGARAWDDSSYPNLKGQWVRVGPAGFNGTRFDPSKPPGRGQEAPLTPEYQVLFEDNLADQAAGGQGTTPTY